MRYSNGKVRFCLVKFRAGREEWSLVAYVMVMAGSSNIEFSFGVVKLSKVM